MTLLFALQKFSPRRARKPDSEYHKSVVTISSIWGDITRFPHGRHVRPRKEGEVFHWLMLSFGEIQSRWQMSEISVWSKGEIVLTEKHWSIRRKKLSHCYPCPPKIPLELAFDRIRAWTERDRWGTTGLKTYLRWWTKTIFLNTYVHLFCEMYSLRMATLNSRNMSQ